MKIYHIVALSSHNNGIGHNGKMLWFLPNELKQFKEITKCHAVIMGRKTFESIGKPLEGRLNIVVSRTLKSIDNDAVLFTNSVHSAIDDLRLNGFKKCFIIGGAEIYKQTQDIIDGYYVTFVNDHHDRNIKPDTFYPMPTVKAPKKTYIRACAKDAYFWETILFTKH